MSATVNVNGRITPERDAVISVFDHGFLYGEGIYETMRTYHRRPFLYDRHMRRLRRSAKMIELPLPFTDEELAAQIRDDAGARRRIDGRSLHPRPRRPAASASSPTIRRPRPTLRSSSSSNRRSIPRQRSYENGVRVVIVDVVRNHPGLGQPDDQEQQPDEQRAGDAGGAPAGAFEGVMRNYRGELTECTHVEPVHRQERRRADAAARRRTAARHHARVPVRHRQGDRRADARSRRCATTIYSAPTRRSSPARRARPCRS